MKKVFFIFKVQCFPCFHEQTRSRVRSSVPLLNRNSQNMIINLNLSAATIRSFKMLIDYTLDLTPPPPFSPCSLSLPKRKRRRRNCFKISTSTGIVVAHANTPSKFFHLCLGTNFLSFDWDLLAFSFQLFKLIFVFISLSPPPSRYSSSDAPFKKVTPKLTEC